MRSNLSRSLRAGSVLAILCLLFIPRLGNAAAPGSIDLTNLDRTCKPCTDFYQFAVGGWIKKNSIPVRIRRIVTFRNWPTRIATYARDFEKVSKTSNPPESNLQKIGDYYGSCMDESRIEAAGVVRPPAQRCQIW